MRLGSIFGPPASARRRGVAARGRRALAPALVLAAAYVAAQALAVAHDLEPEGHPAGEVCALCVTLGTLGVGDVAPAHAATLPGGFEAAASLGAALALLSRRARHCARGPPAAS